MTYESEETLKLVQELAQRMRRMETKAHHICKELGVKSVGTLAHDFVVTRAEECLSIKLPAADIAITTIRDEVKKAGHDPLDVNGVSLVLPDGTIFGTIYFD